jgi:hypothetical protein
MGPPGLLRPRIGNPPASRLYPLECQPFGTVADLWITQARFVSMRKALLFLTLIAFWPAARSAELPQSAVQEIEQLLAALGGSGCRFYRNGSWYSAPDAQAHLIKKYEYLRKKKLLGSPEDFIAKAGTESSRSGEPYRVQCGQQDAVPSAAWLQAALRRLRSGVSTNAGTSDRA